MRYLTPRAMVVLWMLGFAGSFVIQSVFQAWFAAHSDWGANAGWQTEIAIWNVGVFAMLVGVLRSESTAESFVLPGLALLSACFCLNHLLALSHTPDSLSNLAGALANALMVLLYGLHLLYRRRLGQRPSGSP